MTKVDALAIGAHPDDVEINCGGTLLALAGRGRRTAIVDLTRGELASRGTVEKRRRESEEAARILGLEFRHNLELRDGDIPMGEKTRLLLIQVLRECRPRLVLTHSRFGHPDHFSVATLVEEAVHHAGLFRIDTGQERHRPEKIAYWINYNQAELPRLVVDISAHYERKEQAIRAYASQVSTTSDEPATYLSQPGFLGQLRSFHAHLGSLSGCAFAEGFRFSRLPRVGDLVEA